MLTLCLTGRSLCALMTPQFEVVNFINPEVRASVDKMCFMAVYATKTLYEERVPRAQREHFGKVLIDLHSSDDALQQFQAAWIEWLSTRPNCRTWRRIATMKKTRRRRRRKDFGVHGAATLKNAATA